MRLSRWIAVSVFPVVAVVTTASSGRSSSDPAGDHVRRHLDSVLVELVRTKCPARATPVSSAGAFIEELADYRHRGVYPHNYDFREQFVPYFRDRKTGALCAVGDLLAFTGRQRLVDHVAVRGRRQRPRRAASGRCGVSNPWLDENGLTLAEAARIQVVYAYSPRRLRRWPEPWPSVGRLGGNARVALHDARQCDAEPRRVTARRPRFGDSHGASPWPPASHCFTAPICRTGGER